MNCYIPSNLDFESLFPDCRKHRDKYFYFLHKIYEEKLFDSRYVNNSFVNLHSHTLRSIIGERIFYAVRESLEAKEVIEINHSYLVDKFSKSYRLTNKYRNVKHRQVRITDEKILQRIFWHKQKMINNIPDGIEYKFLYNNLNRISINHYEALTYILTNYSFDPYLFNSYKISIDYLNRKNFYFKVDNVAGRIHTNISNLPKELRPFLNYNGQKLINIDISNSQPFLFNILMLNHFSNNFQSPNSLLYNSFNNFLLTSPYVVQFSDVKMYVELTSKGKFYEYVMNEAGVKEKERGIFKKIFFERIFFCKNSKRKYKVAKLFRNLFPNVYDVITDYKKEDYTQLAIKLQSAEAEIMINKICKRIAQERPEIFVSTIHDSILTTEENKDYICSVILNEFESNFNLKPSIKIE